MGGTLFACRARLDELYVSEHGGGTLLVCRVGAFGWVLNGVLFYSVMFLSGERKGASPCWGGGAAVDVVEGVARGAACTRSHTASQVWG